MYKTAIATMTFKMLGPSTAVMAMARIRPGKAYRLSITRLSTRSNGPPRKPASRPSGTPSTRATMEELNPMIRAIRVPQSRRLRHPDRCRWCPE